MEILVTYGAHGDEPVAAQLGESLIRDPVDGSGRLSVLAVNEEAIRQKKRFIDENFALSTRNPDPHSPIYERRQAASILSQCRRGAFNFILDLHTEPIAGSEHALASQHATDETLALAAYFNIDNIVVSEFGIPGACNNALGIGIDVPDGDPQHTIKQWRLMLKEFLEDFPEKEYYEAYMDIAARRPKFWYYGNAILATETTDLREISQAPYDMRSFEPLNTQLLVDMNLAELAEPAHPEAFGLNIDPLVMEGAGIVGEYVYQLPADRTRWAEHIRQLDTINTPNWTELQLPKRQDT